MSVYIKVIFIINTNFFITIDNISCHDNKQFICVLYIQYCFLCLHNIYESLHTIIIKVCIEDFVNKAFTKAAGFPCSLNKKKQRLLTIVI